MGDAQIDVRDRIVAFKRSMAPRREDLKRAYADVTDHVRRAVETILSDLAAQRPVVPEINYADIKSGQVPDASAPCDPQEPAARSCAACSPRVSRATGSRSSATISRPTDYEEREVEKRSLDKYFSALKAGKPQIFNVYWSKPQVMARQDAKLAETRAFLDRLWKYEGVFNPDLQCTYADRVRRRQPGDKTLGLSPHMDAGTVERWIDPGYQSVYENVFAGDWRGYDPFDATHRLETHEIPSPAVCSMFRTYQGWTALTRQGPQDGTLRLIPIAEGISYVLLRALQDDVAEDDLCGATPGRALGVSPEWHADLDRRPGLHPGGHARRHGVLAHRHLPCGRRRARGQRVRQRHLHRLRARLRQEPRVSPEAEARFPRGTLGPRLRRHGLRSRLRGQRNGKRPDRARTFPNGLLSDRSLAEPRNALGSPRERSV